MIVINCLIMYIIILVWQSDWSDQIRSPVNTTYLFIFISILVGKPSKSCMVYAKSYWTISLLILLIIIYTKPLRSCCSHFGKPILVMKRKIFAYLLGNKADTFCLFRCLTLEFQLFKRRGRGIRGAASNKILSYKTFRFFDKYWFFIIFLLEVTLKNLTKMPRT